MKYFVVAFAVIATAAATSVSDSYLPPVQEAALPTQEYLPPVSSVSSEEPTVLADDGYRYKTVRRFRLRHRRDVSELPSNDYLPPVQSAAPLPSQEYLPPVSSVPVGEPTALADDGYRYKTVRRFRLRRRRRDVNELPSNEYLPPVQSVAPLPSQEYLPPVSSVSAGEPTVLADDGYRYKTVRRYRLRRRRRDVNELPSNEYLPPVQSAAPLPSQDYLPPVSSYVSAVSAGEPTVLADDGYRYKTVRRLRLRRRRRDVNELPSNEYLPPVQSAAPLPSQEYLPPVSSVSAGEPTVLADDGYRYKTVRRYRLRRRRRDVNELPSNEYLPPVQSAAPLPSQEYLPPVSSVSAGEPTILADDGYRYKTVRRYRLRRRRRDVNELPSNEYLPPVQSVAPLPSQDYLPPASSVSAGEPTVLADDGYRYKTVRRFRVRRRRRDVNELPSNEYLPPIEQAPVSVAEEPTVLADDGYRYKTVKRYRLRRRRDVSELPSNEYLPPVVSDLNISLAPELSSVLANDGYRYRTVRKLRKYRLRRH